MKRLVHLWRGSRAGQAAVLLPLLYGLCMGYMVWYTFFGYIPRTYPVLWQAPWIAYAPDAEVSQSYFRKKLYLPEGVRHAWLKVMAPDSFQVYVNGKLLGKAQRLAQQVTEFVDITQELQAGINVIAVATLRSTYPGTSKIVLEGMYEDWHGIEHQLASDTSWKVAQYEEWRPGMPQWFDPMFQDVHWRNASALGIPQPDQNSKVPYNPVIYTTKLSRQWIWAPASEAPKSYLRHNVSLPARPQAGWLWVAAKQGYFLFVNGLLIGERQGQTGMNTAPPPPQQPLDVYDITPFLRSQANTIALSAVGELSDRGVLIDGVIVEQSGVQHWLSPPGAWKTATAESPQWTSPDFDDALWLPAELKRLSTPEELFAKHIVESTPPAHYVAVVTLNQGWCILLTMLLSVAWWLLMGHILDQCTKTTLLECSIQASLIYAVPLVFLGVFFLLRYDVRYDLAFPFRQEVIGIDVFLVMLSGLVLIMQGVRAGMESVVTRRSRQYGTAIALSGLIILGLLLRLKDVDYRPLGGDEVTMMLVSQHVLAEGYPAVHISPSLREKVMTTSEIIPYFFALSLKLFAWKSPEFALRFPGVFFGTLSIVLLYCMGKALFSVRVGLLAAALYTVLPVTISFAQFARYPTPTQFFAALAAYWLFRSFTSVTLQHRYLLYGTIACICTYLSWEGTLLYFPGLCLGLVVLRGKDTTWLKDPYFWTGLGALIAVIFFQLSTRILLNQGILVLGSGISDVTLSARWEQPAYEALAFVYNLFLLKNVLFLSCIAAVGLLWVLKDRALLFCYVLVLIPVAITTNAIEVRDTRHVYYVVPFLIVAASAVFFEIVDFLLVKEHVPPALSGAAIIKTATALGCVGLLLCTAHDHVVKLYNIPWMNATTQTLLEFGDNGLIRGVATVLRQESLPGDKILAVMPHMVYFYLQKRNADYYAEQQLGELKIPVLVALDGPRALHRITGSPLLYSSAEVKKMLDQHSRVWLAIAQRMSNFLDQSTQALLGEMSLMFEDQETRLYLWRK